MSCRSIWQMIIKFLATSGSATTIDPPILSAIRAKSCWLSIGMQPSDGRVKSKISWLRNKMLLKAFAHLVNVYLLYVCGLPVHRNVIIESRDWYCLYFRRFISVCTANRTCNKMLTLKSPITNAVHEITLCVPKKKKKIKRPLESKKNSWLGYWNGNKGGLVFCHSAFWSYRAQWIENEKEAHKGKDTKTVSNNVQGAVCQCNVKRGVFVTPPRAMPTLGILK